MKQLSSTWFLGLIACVVLVPSLARAQPDRTTGSTTVGAPFIMPDLDSRWLLGLETSYTRFADNGSGTLINIVNLDLHGQVSVAPGFFLYGRLPTSTITTEGFAEEVEESDLGNLILGTRYVLSRPRLRLGVSASVSLPTSVPPSEGPRNGAATYFSSITRYDIARRYMGEATTYQAQAHLRVEKSTFFFQGLLGFQRLSTTTSSELLHTIHVVLALGARASKNTSLIGEFSTLSTHPEDGTSLGEDNLYHWMRFGSRHDVGFATLAAYMYFPIGRLPIFIDDEFGVLGFVFEITRAF